MVTQGRESELETGRKGGVNNPFTGQEKDKRRRVQNERDLRHTKQRGVKMAIYRKKTYSIQVLNELVDAIVLYCQYFPTNVKSGDIISFSLTSIKKLLIDVLQVVAPKYGIDNPRASDGHTMYRKHGFEKALEVCMEVAGDGERQWRIKDG